MIWRLWSILMVVFVGGVWLLAIPYSPKPILVAGTVIDQYREKGLVPAVGKTTISEEVGHDVFEVPPEDEIELEKAMKMMASGGMNMNMSGSAMEGEKMPAMPGATMPGQAMNTDAMEQAELMQAGIVVLAEGTAGEIDATLAEKSIKVDRNAVINMDEWNFGTNKTTVKAGEVVRIRVNNAGKIPHEFMIMDMAGMQTVAYRQLRADWNLLEHEAFSEVSFLLPGDSAEMVIKVTRPGQWMYMCMFPYHMQLGMMGIMSTPGQKAMAPMKM